MKNQTIAIVEKIDLSKADINNSKNFEYCLSIYSFYVQIISFIEYGLIIFSDVADRSIFKLKEEYLTLELKSNINNIEKIFYQYEIHQKDDLNEKEVAEDINEIKMNLKRIKIILKVLNKELKNQYYLN